MYQRHGVVHDHGNTLVVRSTYVPRHYCGTRLIRKGFQAALPGVHFPTMSFILFCTTHVAVLQLTVFRRWRRCASLTLNFASYGTDGTRSYLLFPKGAMALAVTTYLAFMFRYSGWSAWGVGITRFSSANQNGSMQGKCADSRQWKPRRQRSKDGPCQCLTIMGMVYEAFVSRFPRRLAQAEKKSQRRSTLCNYQISAVRPAQTVGALIWSQRAGQQSVLVHP